MRVGVATSERIPVPGDTRDGQEREELGKGYI
jgi:hypothetical protein